MTNYLTEENIIDDEIAQRRSIEKFLKEKILPKLSQRKQDDISKYSNQGIALIEAFEMAGVSTTMCIRK
jgi:hypothetical protein